jgi:hypothetical protein
VRLELRAVVTCLAIFGPVVRNYFVSAQFSGVS